MVLTGVAFRLGRLVSTLHGHGSQAQSGIRLLCLTSLLPVGHPLYYATCPSHLGCPCMHLEDVGRLVQVT
jgi:hypothetical protein